MMAVAEAQVSRFDMGRTAKRTFSVVGQNIVTFGVLSFLVGIPLAVMSWGGTQFAQPFPARLFDPRAAGFYAVTGLAYFIGSFVLQAGVVLGTIASLNARRASLAECLSVALAAFLPLLLLTLVMIVGIAGGSVLLIVPGIIIALNWSVAVPARLVEHVTLGGALNRSKELTRGHRWAIFGLLVAFTLLNLIIGMIGGVVAGVGFHLPNAAIGSGVSLGGIAVSTSARMIEAILGAALIASIYYELRVIKQGIGPDALASVFD
jgi:hypothetical protein